jgi:hypothetical protein
VESSTTMPEEPGLAQGERGSPGGAKKSPAHTRLGPSPLSCIQLPPCLSRIPHAFSSVLGPQHGIRSGWMARGGGAGNGSVPRVGARAFASRDHMTMHIGYGQTKFLRWEGDCPGAPTLEFELFFWRGRTSFSLIGICFGCQAPGGGGDRAYGPAASMEPMALISYEGETDEDGLQHGIGIAFYQGAATYAGEFKEGLRHGRGLLDQPYVCRYLGAFQDDWPHGEGVMLDLTRSACYRGEFDAMQFVRGVARDKHALSWGEYADGELRQGTRIQANGGYEGQFQDGRYHGRGVAWAWNAEGKLKR